MTRAHIHVYADVKPSRAEGEPIGLSDAEDVLVDRIRAVIARAQSNGELDDPDGLTIISEVLTYTDYEG